MKPERFNRAVLPCSKFCCCFDGMITKTLVSDTVCVPAFNGWFLPIFKYCMFYTVLFWCNKLVTLWAVDNVTEGFIDVVFIVGSCSMFILRTVCLRACVFCMLLFLTAISHVTIVSQCVESTGAVLGRQNTSSDNLPPNMAANDFLQWNATLLSCSNSRVQIVPRSFDNIKHTEHSSN